MSLIMFIVIYNVVEKYKVEKKEPHVKDEEFNALLSKVSLLENMARSLELQNKEWKQTVEIKNVKLQQTKNEINELNNRLSEMESGGCTLENISNLQKYIKELSLFKNTVLTHIPDWKEQIEENSADNAGCNITYSNHVSVDSSLLGEDFERFVGWTFKNKGWDVIYHGIENGVNDLGRDLIATMGDRACIIQCKNWDCFNRTIRENVICQLYGTAMAYQVEHPHLNVIPVLATTTMLSHKAKIMAKLLKIKIGYYKIKVNGQTSIPYPQIKCNINSENRKIYHEPGCPCYYRTKIVKDGEFYTQYISEARRMGFLPCHKH